MPPLPSAPLNVLYTVVFALVGTVFFLLYSALRKRAAQQAGGEQEGGEPAEPQNTSPLAKFFLAAGFACSLVAVGFFAMALAIRLGMVFGWYYW